MVPWFMAKNCQEVRFEEKKDFYCLQVKLRGVNDTPKSHPHREVL